MESSPIIRIPILFKREPIILSKSAKLIALAKKEISTSLKKVRTYDDNKIWEIIDYYASKVRSVLHITVYRPVTQSDFRNHKNWRHFKRVRELCKTNKWDYHIYIDAQFERVKGYTRVQKYPYINQLYSDGAQQAYKRYLKEQEELYLIDITKVKHKETKKLRQEIIDAIVSDCMKICDGIELYGKRKINRNLSKEEILIKWLENENWLALSPYFLSVNKDFVTFLDGYDLDNNPIIKELREDILGIQKNKRLIEIIQPIKDRCMKSMEIPLIF